jgi:hypothetical protein
MGKNKSAGPYSVSGDILKLGREAMAPYLARLFDITVNNDTIQSDWKKAIMVSVYKPNYRTVSLTSVVCRQVEHLDKKEFVI